MLVKLNFSVNNSPFYSIFLSVISSFKTSFPVPVSSLILSPFMRKGTSASWYSVSSFFMWCFIACAKVGCHPFGPSKLLCENVAPLLDADIYALAVKEWAHCPRILKVWNCSAHPS